MHVVFACEVGFDDGLNFLLEALRVILIGRRLGLVLAIRVLALGVGLRELRMTSDHDLGHEWDVLEPAVNHLRARPWASAVPPYFVDADGDLPFACA